MMANVSLDSMVFPSTSPLPHLGIEGLQKGKLQILTSDFLNGEILYMKVYYSSSLGLYFYYIMEDCRSHGLVGWTSGSDRNNQRVEELEKHIIEI